MNSLLKIIRTTSLWMFFLLLFAAAAADAAEAANHSSAPFCYDATGTGLAVGNGNSGIITFDNTGGNPSFAYHLCTKKPSGGTVAMEGWAWNSNVGWVSAFCNGGSNSGVGCGGVNYTSEIDTSTGKMSGYWWGDGIGWISLNCTDLGVCGTSNYAVEFHTTGANKGEVKAGKGYAWSDNLGWVNLQGMEINWLAATIEEPDVADEPDTLTWNPFPPPANLADNVFTTIYPDPAIYSSTSGDLNDIAADGNTKYQLMVYVGDNEGNALDNTKIDVDVTLTKTDTVRINQVDNPTTSDFGINWGGVTSSTNSSESILPDPVYSAPYWRLDLSSIAPTSNMNAVDIPNSLNVKNGKMDCYFSVSAATEICDEVGTPADKFKAVIENLRVVVTDKTVLPNAVVYDGSITGTLPFYGDKELKFVPMIDMDYFSVHPTKDSPYFSVARNQLLNLSYQIKSWGLMTLAQNTIDVALSASTDDADLPLVFLTSTNATDAGTEVIDYTRTTKSFNLGGITLGQKYSDIFAIAALKKTGNVTADKFVDDPRVKSVISYVTGGKTVKYFHNGLPRIKSEVSNPVADISGPVQTRGAVKVQDNVDVRSFGDISTNVVRETVLRNVKALLAGKDVSSLATNDRDNMDHIIINTLQGDTGYTNLAAEVMGQGVLLGESGDVAYFKGNVRITDTTWWTDDMTIIVDGGHVFIDTDLVSPNDKRLGLIVLENPLEANPMRRGGNVYIADAAHTLGGSTPVRDFVKVNIFADGSVMRYNQKLYVFGSNGIDDAVSSNGEPIYGEFDEVVKHQLYWKGSVSSLNTIGGADRETAILGDGTELKSGAGSKSSIEDIQRAKIYDFNYLSRFRLQYEWDYDADPPAPKNLVAPATIGEEDLVPYNEGTRSAEIPVQNNNPVIFDYDPPAADHPGFEPKGSLPGVEFLGR